MISLIELEQAGQARLCRPVGISQSLDRRRRPAVCLDGGRARLWRRRSTIVDRCSAARDEILGRDLDLGLEAAVALLLLLGEDGERVVKLCMVPAS